MKETGCNPSAPPSRSPLQLIAHSTNDFIDIVALVGLVEDRLPVGTNLKDAAVTGHQRDRFDVLAELREDRVLEFARSVEVATRNAVLDFNACHGSP